MRFMKQASPRISIGYGVALGLVAALGIVPWTVVVAQSPTADKVEPKQTVVSGKFTSFQEGVLKIKVPAIENEIARDLEWKVAENTLVVSHIPNGVAKEGAAGDAFKFWEAGAAIAVKLQDGKVTRVDVGNKKSSEKVANNARQQSKTVWGKFVSFQAGTLTIKANSGALLGNKISDHTKTLVWSGDAGQYASADTATTLNQAKVGTWCIVTVADEIVMLRMGARKGSVTGTFVSFKDDRLLMLGKDLGESFTKKYGNNLHFSKFAAGVPAYESVDGGEYKLIGIAENVLGSVKEGAIITVHSEGDDNATLVQIGVPDKK